MTDETESVLDQYMISYPAPHALSSAELLETAAREMLLPVPSVKLPGFPKLTKITGGFRGYEFSILCGSTGTGKTTLCANLSREFLKQRVPHFVASVETGHHDFIRRVISAMVGKDWNTGDPIPLEEFKAFMAEYGALISTQNLQLSLHENRFSVENLMADLAWMVKNKGIKVAIIDNLNFFLEVTRAADQVVEMDRVTHELVIFCKKVDVHLIMVMHPKKTQSGRVETEFDIKGSSTAVQEAHNIFLWNRPHPDLLAKNLAEPSDRELFIAKMRRKGKYVRSRLIFKQRDCTSYFEGECF